MTRKLCNTKTRSMRNLCMLVLSFFLSLNLISCASNTIALKEEEKTKWENDRQNYLSQHPTLDDKIRAGIINSILTIGMSEEEALLAFYQYNQYAKTESNISAFEGKTKISEMRYYYQKGALVMVVTIENGIIIDIKR